MESSEIVCVLTFPNSNLWCSVALPSGFCLLAQAVCNQTAMLQIFLGGRTKTGDLRVLRVPFHSQCATDIMIKADSSNSLLDMDNHLVLSALALNLPSI